MELGSPVIKLLFVEVYSWTLCFITNEKGAESSKILKVFIHVPLLTRDDDRLYFPALVGYQRPLWGTLVRLPRPLSLMFLYSRRVTIVLRWSLYGVVSDGRVLGLFVPLPPAVLTGFPQEPTPNVESASPVKWLLYAGGAFLDALLYFQ